MKKNVKMNQSLLRHQSFVRVLYKDTDQMGVAYYANYLVWFELGRTELMRAIGLPYQEVEKQGIRLPVSRCSCNYKAPAYYDDVLIIETEILDLTDVSISFGYKIYRKETGELLTTGETKHPFLGAEGKFVRFGPTLLPYIQKYRDTGL